MKLLTIAIVLIVFVGSFLLGFQVRAKELGIKLYDIGDASSLPVLMGTETYPVLSAQGVIAVDLNSNTTLYEKNADQPLYPASTTKIVTALVGLDYYSPDQVLTVINPQVEGQKMGLMTNEKMTFDNLLNGLLIYSANDAAITIADNYPGGRDAFVAAMNAKIQDLHLENSHFANPVGLDDETQLVTARDMVRVAEIAMQNPKFASIVGTKEKTVTDVTGKYNYDLVTVNQLLGSVDGVIGIKTGYTEAARENLVTDVVRNNHNVFITVLGSQDRFGETRELINWVYGSYNWQAVTYTQKVVGMILK
jgi:serine-type D-Ala-D-Ala carboxypeptidase (penicillin-binding protein 5/6)